MTIRTRIHDLIDQMGLLRSKMSSDASIEIQARESEYKFIIKTASGTEKFNDLSSTEQWVSDILVAIGTESDPKLARILVEREAYKQKLQRDVARLTAELNGMTA